ncbi:hypothetical protein JW977_02170, partial [Candidatus Falkowbacteria bacterium]|nr:hypothetical protein [Candidatus Falkowbacteria bacterium]
NEKISFGKLLLKYNIYTTRKLLYFFKVRKSELMKYYNIETKSNFLYGRKYIIKTEGNKVLARVIEILK